MFAAILSPVRKTHEGAIKAWESRKRPNGNGQDEAIKAYTGDYAGDINHRLRGTKAPVWKVPRDHEPTPEELDRHIQNMDSLISSSTPFSKDMALYRGVSHDIPTEVGAVFKEKGYSSTSTSKSVALDFGHDFGHGSEAPTVLVIRVKAGTRAAHVNLEGEKEHILPRGSTFKVVSAKKGKYETVVTVDLMPRVEKAEGFFHIFKTHEGALKAWETRYRAAKPAIDKVVVFHGTQSSVVESILKDGLTISHAGSKSGGDAWLEKDGGPNDPLIMMIKSTHRPASVFGTTHEASAKDYAKMLSRNTKNLPVILKLAVPKEEFNKFNSDEIDFSDGKRSEKDIPSSWIVGVSIAPKTGDGGRSHDWKGWKPSYKPVQKSDTQEMYLIFCVDTPVDEVSKADGYSNVFKTHEGALKAWEKRQRAQQFDDENFNHWHKVQFKVLKPAVKDPKTGKTLEKQVSEWQMRDGSPLPANLKAQMQEVMPIPPGWSDVRVNPNPTETTQVVARDANAKRQIKQLPSGKAENDAVKWVRVHDFHHTAYNPIMAASQKAMEDTKLSQRERDLGAVVNLVGRTAFRIGGSKTDAKDTAYGASTLLKKHIKINGDTLKFAFVGKHAVNITKTLEDAPLAHYLSHRLPHIKANEPVFTATDNDARQFIKKVTGIDRFHPKDFRTWHATGLALAIRKAIPAPKTAKEYAEKQKMIATKVSEHLGNTPSVALSSYISPVVWKRWDASLAPKPKVKKEEGVKDEYTWQDIYDAIEEASDDPTMVDDDDSALPQPAIKDDLSGSDLATFGGLKNPSLGFGKVLRKVKRVVQWKADLTGVDLRTVAGIKTPDNNTPQPIVAGLKHLFGDIGNFKYMPISQNSIEPNIIDPVKLTQGMAFIFGAKKDEDTDSQEQPAWETRARGSVNAIPRMLPRLPQPIDKPKKVKVVSKTGFASVLKFNPNHAPTGSPEGGQFTSGNSNEPPTGTAAQGLFDRGSVSGSPQRLESSGGTPTEAQSRPLEGLSPSKVNIPGYGPTEVGPYLPARQAAYDYMKSAGLEYDPPTTYVKVDPARATKIAQASANSANTVFADQKTGLMPEWVSTEGARKWELAFVFKTHDGAVKAWETRARGSINAVPRMISRIIPPDGGFTYNPRMKSEPKEGFAVSIYPERSRVFDVKSLSPHDLSTYVRENLSLLKQGGTHLGAWHDPDSGKVFLDVSLVVHTAKEAANLCRKHDQIAYFDLKACHSVTVNKNATSGGVVGKEDHGQVQFESARPHWGSRGGYADAGRSVQGVDWQGMYARGTAGVGRFIEGFTSIFKTHEGAIKAWLSRDHGNGAGNGGGRWKEAHSENGALHANELLGAQYYHMREKHGKDHAVTVSAYAEWQKSKDELTSKYGYSKGKIGDLSLKSKNKWSVDDLGKVAGVAPEPKPEPKPESKPEPLKPEEPKELDDPAEKLKPKEGVTWGSATAKAMVMKAHLTALQHPDNEGVKVALEHIKAKAVSEGGLTKGQMAAMKAHATMAFQKNKAVVGELAAKPEPVKTEPPKAEPKAAPTPLKMGEYEGHDPGVPITTGQAKVPLNEFSLAGHKAAMAGDLKGVKDALDKVESVKGGSYPKTIKYLKDIIDLNEGAKPEPAKAEPAKATVEAPPTTLEKDTLGHVKLPGHLTDLTQVGGYKDLPEKALQAAYAGDIDKLKLVKLDAQATGKKLPNTNLYIDQLIDAMDPVKQKELLDADKNIKNIVLPPTLDHPPKEPPKPKTPNPKYAPYSPNYMPETTAFNSAEAESANGTKFGDALVDSALAMKGKNVADNVRYNLLSQKEKDAIDNHIASGFQYKSKKAIGDDSAYPELRSALNHDIGVDVQLRRNMAAKWFFKAMGLPHGNRKEMWDIPQEKLDSLIGKTYREDAFSSTTYATNSPINFTNTANESGALALMIRAPKTTKGYWVGGGEREVLLQQGTTYTISKIVRDPGSIPNTKGTPLYKVYVDAIGVTDKAKDTA